MKTLALLLLGAALVAGRPQAEPSRDLHGGQLLTVQVERMNDLRYLNWLQSNTLLDFWTEPRFLGSINVMARRWDLPMLKKTLERHGMEYTVAIPDMATHAAQMKARTEEARSKSTKMDWTSYHTYEEIDAWLDEVVAANQDVATVTQVGTSYEGRPMRALKLSTGPGRQAIFTDGGIHAREWISPATVTYIIDQVLQNDKDLLNYIDMVFMPVINPDGYAYTFSDDRYWRKTRSVNVDSPCLGTDPNRNWDWHWDEGGASDTPCSDTYHGPVPFSEVEMQVVRDQIPASNTKVYLTFHSYSQMWMYPWGYTYDLPADWQDLDALAQDAVSALTAVHGTTYEVGSSANVIYIAAGGSDDWAKGAGGSKYAYTIELRDRGLNGFDLPEAQIIPTGEETYAAFKVVAEFLSTNTVP